MFLMSARDQPIFGALKRPLTPTLAVLPPSANLNELDIVLRLESIFQSSLLQLALEVIDMDEDLGFEDFSKHVQAEA
jgi:hypothetical protein